MTDERRYGSPEALRNAVTDRLKSIAKPLGRWTLSELQRQFAYDRLLARLYAVDDRWIVKGAVALLARRISVRHTVDIDIYRAAEPAAVERELRTAAAEDLQDWFRFDIGPAEPLAAGGGGTCHNVKAFVGGTVWASYHIDLVGAAVHMTGSPDDVSPLVTVEIPGMVRRGYKAYPLVDHVADKVAAILEPHGGGRPSTRFRDLVDLTALVSNIHVDATGQRAAILSETQRRGLTTPERFTVPDRLLWERGMAQALRHAVDAPAHDLDEAMSMVRPFIDPVLDGSARGTWDPAIRAWIEG